MRRTFGQLSIDCIDSQPSTFYIDLVSNDLLHYFEIFVNNGEMMKKNVSKANISARASELPSLGQLLRETRTRRGFSQTELAEKLGVSKQHLSAIENGVNMISFSKASEIAKVLGLSAESLVIASFHDHVMAAGINISPGLRTSLVAVVQGAVR